jgi:hypothetical protein
VERLDRLVDRRDDLDVGLERHPEELDRGLQELGLVVHHEDPHPRPLTAVRLTPRNHPC